jgi:hypothetical protein
MIRRLAIPAVFAAGFLLHAAPARAQDVSLDGAVRAAGLWCFPLATDSLVYVYLPDRAALSSDESGRPQFSFIRYIIDEPSGDAGAESLTDASGGAILTFLVSYETPQEIRDAAEQELRAITGLQEARLRGPVLFQSGEYSLVSSILLDGSEEQRVLATGRAPVLEGNRIALSFELSPEDSKLLLESLQMATPDVSLVFDMVFLGRTRAYDAELVVDWTKVNIVHGGELHGTVYFVGADIEVMFERMRQDNTITLRSSGSDQSMQALLETVYSRLLTLMFEPVKPAALPEPQRKDLMSLLSGGANAKAMSEAAQNASPFGLRVGYTHKNVRSEGETTLTFNHEATQDRYAMIAFNIGDLYEEYGDDPAFFRTVNLLDPAFELREVRVGVDGALLPEFERYVNSAAITLRKTHSDGKVTLRELVVDRRTFSSELPDLRMTYGWSGDDDRTAWLDYEYRSHWSFRDGGSFDSDWETSDKAMINLYVPYERRVIQLVVDEEALLQANVRAVSVDVSYPFFGERRHQQETLILGRDNPVPEIELTLPRDQFNYDYQITWHMRDADPRVETGTARTAVLFIDELPTE